MSKQFVITSILVEQPSTLRLQYADGERFTLDLTPVIQAYNFARRVENAPRYDNL
jgi:hypothetical protein